MPRRARNTGKQPNFRLRKEARTLDFEWVNRLSEEDAYEYFKAIRFRRNDGQPFCPCCGSLRCYTIKTRPRWWSCGEKGCRKQFSVTSGTIFHSRKMPFLKLLKLMCKFLIGVKGMSALQLSIAIDAQYKSTYVNVMKLRQAMAAARDDVELGPEIELDCAYFGGNMRQANMKADRVDRRKVRNGKRRVLMVLADRNGKCVSFAADGETGQVAVAAVRALVPPDRETEFFSDGSSAYEDLEAFGKLHVGDHSKGFCVDGVTTNRAESFFSRCRRGLLGTYHKMETVWLDLYAGEFAWRENAKVTPSRECLDMLVQQVMDHRISRMLKGYWQNWELPDALLDRAELRWDKVFGPLYEGRTPRAYRLTA